MAHLRDTLIELGVAGSQSNRVMGVADPGEHDVLGR